MNVELRQWTFHNKEELTDICNRADRSYLSNRLPYPYTEQDGDWWLNMVGKKDGTGGVFRAVLVDGEYAGNISVEKKEGVYGRDGEIGYFLLTDKWSRGIMTEAVRQICEIAFNELDIVRITGLVFGPNIASKRVLEKNGFTLEGLMRQAVSKDGNLYDLCIYGKLAGEV